MLAVSAAAAGGGLCSVLWRAECPAVLRAFVALLWPIRKTFAGESARCAGSSRIRCSSVNRIPLSCSGVAGRAQRVLQASGVVRLLHLARCRPAARMKLKELHALMQDVEPFAQPKVVLEQYPTGPDIASRMLYTIQSMYDDLGGKVVLDLGTGTGMLAIGAALLGSPCVLGADIDADALEVAARNCEQFEEPLPIDFLRTNVLQLPAQARLAPDTVVMNPPFGTKIKGADVAFLRVACALGPAAVYSLHKSSTRGHIEKVALRELGCSSAEVLAELRYNLPATMRFHKQASVDIEVDLWRFELPAAQQRRRRGSSSRSSSSSGESDEAGA